MTRNKASKTATTAARISVEVKATLDSFSKQSGRTRRHIADAAITEYVTRYNTNTASPSVPAPQ